MIAGTAGPFELGRELGRGGVGLVYEAIHRATGEIVALKVPRPELGEAARARIAHEAAALARLRHPGIIACKGAGVTLDGAPWLALERLSGADLRASIQRGPAAAGLVLTAALELLAALEVVHLHGLVHRDLKPANVFRCDDGSLRLLDFGVAYVPGLPALERPGACVGSPRFMAPEQLAGRPFDARTDVYSLGLLLYELCAGHGPFDEFRSSFSGMRYAHLKLRPRRLGHRVAVDPVLDAVVDRALEKRPEDRFSSARAMRIALEAIPRGHAASGGALRPAPGKAPPSAPMLGP